MWSALLDEHLVQGAIAAYFRRGSRDVALSRPAPMVGHDHGGRVVTEIASHDRCRTPGLGSIVGGIASAWRGNGWPASSLVIRGSLLHGLARWPGERRR